MEESVDCTFDFYDWKLIPSKTEPATVKYLVKKLVLASDKVPNTEVLSTPPDVYFLYC